MNMDEQEIYWTMKEKKKNRREIHIKKYRCEENRHYNKGPGFNDHIFISKKKNRHHPSLGSVVPPPQEEEPDLYIHSLCDHIASHCIPQQRYVEKMTKRKYRTRRNTFRPNTMKLLHSKPTFLPHGHDTSVTAYCVTCCGDWCVILDPARKHECFLWNCVSHQKIQLPRLHWKKNYYKCILTAPPTERHCHVLFFNPNESLILYCGGVGSKFWSRLRYFEDIEDFYSQAICCNGKVYAARPDVSLLYEIPITKRTVIDVRHPCADGGEVDVVIGLEKQHLVESGGQVFLVQRFISSVSRIKIYRMDFSRDEWVRVHSLGDRVFFLSCNHSVSVSAEEIGIEGNCIYFTDQEDPGSLYGYNLGDKSLSVSKNCPNSGAPWLMWDEKLPVLRLKDNSASEELDGRVEEKEEEDVNVEEGDIFELLPLGVLGKIGQCLGPGRDYTNFRLVCTRWSLAAPPCRWRRDSTSPLMQYPWLVFYTSKQECNFYDPGQGLLMYQKEAFPAADCVIRYSDEDGWLLCSGQGDRTLFLFQQLTRKRIDLPDLPYENACGFCFSGSPGSKDFQVVGIAQEDSETSIVFYLCSISKRWFDFDSTPFLPSQNNPVFLKGKFHFLGQDGISGQLNILPGGQEYEWSVLDESRKLQFPTRVCQSFLVKKESDQLLSVFVGSLGKWIRVYRYGWRAKKWLRTISLNDGTLFLSETKSIYLTAEETVATMKNKIYFPRFSTTTTNGGSPRILAYSMESRRFGTGEEEDVGRRDFYDTKQELNCTWFRDSLIPSV